MATPVWQPAQYPIATVDGVRTVTGYVYRGLGMHVAVAASPKGRRPPRWSLTHLGSGHKLCNIDGDRGVAFPLASEVAQCGNWQFAGLRGYMSRDAALRERVAEIIARHRECSPGVVCGPNEERAREIAARAS